MLDIIRNKQTLLYRLNHARYNYKYVVREKGKFGDTTDLILFYIDFPEFNTNFMKTRTIFDKFHTVDKYAISKKDFPFMEHSVVYTTDYLYKKALNNK